MRVITTSKSFLNMENNNDKDDISCITAVSAVLRLGRSGALTDHSSVLFDVGVPRKYQKMSTTATNTEKKDEKESKNKDEDIIGNENDVLGKIKKGMTNSHWYKMGFKNIFQCSWLPEIGFESHPDEPKPQVTGKVIPGMQDALDVVIRYGMSLFCTFSLSVEIILNIEISDDFIEFLTSRDPGCFIFVLSSSLL